MRTITNFNPFLVTALSAWIVSQVLKTIIYAIQNRSLDWRRLFGDSGMPSSHSAIVTSLATITGLQVGFSSWEFAIATVLATIVCHDARGVRREVGKQAMALNEIIEWIRGLNLQKGLTEEKMKELVGHTPTQVFFGIITGCLVALICNLFFVG